MKIHLVICALFLFSCSSKQGQRGPASVESKQTVKDIVVKANVLKNKAQQVHSWEKRSLIIEFTSIPDSAELEKVQSILNGSRLTRFFPFPTEYFKRLYQFRFEGNKEMAKRLLDLIEEFPFVNKVEFDFNFESYSIEVDPDVPLITSDSFSTYQWGLVNNGQVILRDLDDIHLERVLGKKGVDLGVAPLLTQIGPMMKEEVIVAVLDSGLDYQHPDLKNNIFKNEKECNSRGLPPFKMKEDKDENGFKGDCIGWNFTAKEAGGNNKVTDLQGHGTHVAGVMGAELDNAIGVAGISNKIKILPIKVLGKNERGRNPNGSLTSRIAKGILYATKMGAKVINMSLGWPVILDTKYLRKAFEEAQNAGITIVAAAGNNNNNSPVYPCAYKNVICVGSISNNGAISHFSNYGGYVNLLAPGDNILSTFPIIKDPSFFSVKGYEIKNGTSQASPFVAGAVAVLKGIKPEISEDEIKARLYRTSYSPNHFTENKKYSGFGLLNLKKAIEVEDLSLVIPQFKDLSAISISGEDSSFELKLTLKNLGARLEGLKVKLDISEEHITLEDNEFDLAKMDKGEELVLSINGTVKDTSLDNNMSLILKIQKGPDHKVYKNEFKLSQSSQKDDRFETFAIEEIENTPIGKIEKGRFRTFIKTVSDPLLYKNNPEYYLTKKPKEDENTGMNIFILKSEEGFYKKKLDLFIANAQQVLFIQVYDLNFDEKPDYLVGTIGKKGQDRFIKLSFFDEKGESLYGDYGHWELTDSVAFLEDLRKVAIIPTELKGYGKVGTLTFFNHQCSPSKCNLGMVPIEDQDPDPWKEKDFSKGKHFFFISPTIENGSVKAKVRVMDNFKWTQQLKKKLKIAWNDNINILELLPQSKIEQSKGIARGVISVGKNFFTKGHTVSVNTKGHLKLTPIRSDKIKVEGNQVTPVVDLSGIPKVNSATSFYGIYDPTTIRFSHLSGISRADLNLNNTPTTETVYQIISSQSKICLTGDLVTQKVYQFQCNKPDGKTLEWKINKIENNKITISERDNCLTVPKYKRYRSWDSFAYKKKCDKGKDQVFELIKDKGSYFIRSELTQKCISPSTKAPRDLHDIIQKKCKPSHQHKWELKKITRPIEGKDPHVLSENSYQFENSVLFRVKNKRDHIIRLISSFKKDNLHYNLLETKSNLKIHIYDAQTEESKTLTKPISRFSFLPGSLFSESLFPIFIGQGNQRRPALYIDATQISRGDIYVMTINSKNEIISPIKYNIRVPKNCRPMNPVARGAEKVMNFTLICNVKTSTGPIWTLRYLKVD